MSSVASAISYLGAGLSPTLSVVIPLGAAFVGALAGGGARYLLDRRAENAEFRAAIWVIAASPQCRALHRQVLRAPRRPAASLRRRSSRHFARGWLPATMSSGWCAV